MKFCVTCIFVLSVFAGTLHAEPPARPDDKRTIEAQLDRTLPEVSFDGVGFSDVVDFLRDVTGANVVIDWKHLEQARVDRNVPIKLKLKNQKFRTVLQAICDAAGDGKVVYQVAGGAVIISTKDGAAILVAALKADISHWDEKTRAKMARKLPEVTFDGVRLSDALDFMADVVGVKIQVDWDAFPTEGPKGDTPVSAKLRNMAFGDSLRLIFQSAADKPIEITDKDGVLHIGPAAKSEKPADKLAK